jgi:hypothetical protein
MTAIQKRQLLLSVYFLHCIAVIAVASGAIGGYFFEKMID